MDHNINPYINYFCSSGIKLDLRNIKISELSIIIDNYIIVYIVIGTYEKK